MWGLVEDCVRTMECGLDQHQFVKVEKGREREIERERERENLMAKMFNWTKVGCFYYILI